MSFLFHVGDLLLDGKEPVDDAVDKVHRRVTIIFLLLLSLPLFTKQFAGEPIECFTPTYFTEAQSRYVNSYCWTVSTFYPQRRDQYRTLHHNSGMPRPSSKDGLIHSVDYIDEYDIEPVDQPTSHSRPGQKQLTRVNYYQWAPMILLAKAVTFYVPFALWKILARQRGVSLRQLMKRIRCLRHLNSSHPERQDLMDEIMEHMQVLMYGNPSGCRSKMTRKNLRHFGNYRLVVVYLMVKCLYVLNVLLQFYLLVSFLGEDYLTHGWDILRHFWTHSEWWSSPRFPLQTLCSVRAAQQGSLRLYQCHCVLPINLFNEKICSIWWFYITALLPVTVASLIGWTVRCFARSSRLEFIQRYLTEDEKEGTIPAILLENLGPDGLLLLRLIEINHGSAVLHPVVRCLQQRMAEMAASQTQPASGSISLDLDSSLAPGRPNEDSASPSTPAGLRARRVLGLKNPRHDVTASFRSSSPLSLSLLRRRQHRLASADPFRRLRMRHSLQIHPGSNPALLY